MPQRIQQLTPSTISEQWYEDGAVVDPGTVTVGITRADGSTLVAAGTATNGTGTNPRTFNLSATHTALLDTLRVTWTSSTKGTLTSVVEVVGGFLFSLADLRAVATDTVAYPVSKLSEARTYAESELEKAVGFALVPRYSRETITTSRQLGMTQPYVKTGWPYVRAVRDATSSGSPLDASQIAQLTFTQNFVFGYTWPYTGVWNWTTGVVVIGYEHGLDADNDLSPGARQAALALAADYLGVSTTDGSIDPRATRIITVDGEVQLRQSAGQFSAIGVNEWVAANRLPKV